VISRRSAWSVSLTAIALLVTVAWYQYRGPAPKSAEAPAGQFSALRALAVLQRILGDQSPHPLGSEANDAVRQRLLEELRRLDLRVEVQTTRAARFGTCQNVLASWPTDSPSDAAPLVLASHYDSVSAGPGAADAGSCVAALVETVRALKQGPPPTRPFYVLLTDGEERGLLGAREFVRDHPLAKREALVLNFDARGASGASIMYETHEGNLPLIREVAGHFPRPALCGSLFVTVYRLLPNDTDFTEFQRAGWHGMNFAFIGSPHRYHTPQDRIENLSLRSLQHHGENALAMARTLMVADLPQESSADAVFFDVLGALVVWFPVSWALPLAFVSLVLLAVGCRRVWLRRATWRAVFRAVIAIALSVGVSIMVAWLVAKLAGSLGWLPRRFVAFGGMFVAVYYLIGTCVAYGWARKLLRNLSTDSVWAATWLIWALASVAVAAVLPGFCHLALIPSLTAAVLSLAPLDRTWSTVLMAIVSGVVLVPIVYLLPIAMGPQPAPLYALVICLAWTPLQPLVAAGQSDPVSC